MTIKNLKAMYPKDPISRYGGPEMQALILAKLATVPPAASKAFDEGFRLCAKWANRDDLNHDIGSPAYSSDKEKILAGSTIAPALANEVENIRKGEPYNDLAFEALCRDHNIWGTPQSALCAVFWRAAQVSKA